MSDVFIGLLVAVGIVCLVVFGVVGLTTGDITTSHTREGNCLVTDKYKSDWFKSNHIYHKVECFTPEDRAKYDQLQKLKKEFKEEDLDR